MLIDFIRQWWHDLWTEPTKIGVEPAKPPRGPLMSLAELDRISGYDGFDEESLPLVLDPTGEQRRVPRLLFPAPAWVVPAAGPNEPGPGRAEQLFPTLVDYEWDILFDAHGLPTPSGGKVIYGAAYNECGEFLRKSGITDLMGKPTQLGQDLIAMKRGRDIRRIDVV